MTYTYDLNEGGKLIIYASPQERKWLAVDVRGPVGPYGETNRSGYDIEWDALEPLVCNSELEWIRPEEIGALTSAPILGIRNSDDVPIAAWGFMDYAVRSFVDDLIDTGKAVFIS